MKLNCTLRIQDYTEHDNWNAFRLKYHLSEVFQTSKIARNSQWFKFSAKNSLKYINTVLSVYFWHSTESLNIKTYQRIEFTQKAEEQRDAAYHIQVQVLSYDATIFRGR